MHYAITGKTAAELIYERVDSEKIHMGFTNWKKSPDGKIMKYDISVAETEEKEKKTMMMSDWIEVADDLLKYRKKKILDGSGTISHKKAIEKAENEYEKFRIKQDREYISSMDEM